jgi:hypothetical protein
VSIISRRKQKEAEERERGDKSVASSKGDQQQQPGVMDVFSAAVAQHAADLLLLSANAESSSQGTSGGGGGSVGGGGGSEEEPPSLWLWRLCEAHSKKLGGGLLPTREIVQGVLEALQQLVEEGEGKCQAALFELLGEVRRWTRMEIGCFSHHRQMAHEICVRFFFLNEHFTFELRSSSCHVFMY